MKKPQIKISKTIFLRTFGCQMNEYDSELIHNILSPFYDFTNNLNNADVILLNTCSVREHANDVVFNYIHRVRHELNGKPIIFGLLGCMATDFKNYLLKDPKLKVDFIAGPDSYKNLPHLLEKACQGHKGIHTDLSLDETYSDILPKRTPGINAWVAIMRGCNNFCSYCIVPFTRGRERSRPVASIVGEVKNLVQNGYKQVTLLGQNVNSYHYENANFTSLIRAIAEISGIQRIRFMSPHPKDFSDELLEAIKELPQVCKHIHLPLQSGSEHILALMNRCYTPAGYLSLIEKIKTRIPYITLTTDIIAGFPKETEKEFQETVDLVTRIRFDSAFIFKYSERNETLAAQELGDNVPEYLKVERVQTLNDIQKKISLEKNEELIGSVQEVLIEKETTKKSENDVQGRTDGNKLVILPKGPYKTGDMVSVRITGASANILKGLAL